VVVFKPLGFKGYETNFIKPRRRPGEALMVLTGMCTLPGEQLPISAWEVQNKPRAARGAKRVVYDNDFARKYVASERQSKTIHHTLGQTDGSG
jgi:hypothetical protein